LCLPVRKSEVLQRYGALGQPCPRSGNVMPKATIVQFAKAYRYRSLSLLEAETEGRADAIDRRPRARCCDEAARRLGAGGGSKAAPVHSVG
jgi:hypothetical protein